MPDPDDFPDVPPASAGAIRTVANVLGVLAGVLFLTAFGIGVVQQDEWKVMYLAFGVLFLLFPLLVRRRTRSER